MSEAFAERIYREYMTFFERAERTRRWSVFNDIPWDQAESCPRDPTLALCAETFSGVEMYLPDYVSEGINVMRDNFGQAWFTANWGYEESRHALALREYLLRTGQRTAAQNYAFERTVLGKKWRLPFLTARQMTFYGALQERTTFVIYAKQEALARDKGDALLATIYGLIKRDEMAHSRFYERVGQFLLEEDPQGAKADLAHVFRNFTMPAHDLIPDYDGRVEVMRSAGIDRGVFIREVWLATLKQLGVNRADLPPASAIRATEGASAAR
jgi:acyl-[acyl-carrier-protein] desaturase